LHGVVSGDLETVTYTDYGSTTKVIESAAVELVYTPAIGFVGHEVLTMRVSDPFWGSSTVHVDIVVTECSGQPGEMVPILVEPGEVLPLIVPLTFASVYETAWETVTLIAESDGVSYQAALSAAWNESIGRHIVSLDTVTLLAGRYRLKLPLGNGEIVELMIEVSEAT